MLAIFVGGQNPIQVTQTSKIFSYTFRKITMPKPVAAVLYLATTLATVLVGLMSFNFYHAAISPTNSRWLGPLVVSEFAVPTVFILATISVLRANSKSRVPQAVTAAVVVVLLILLFSHEGLA